MQNCYIFGEFLVSFMYGNYDNRSINILCDRECSKIIIDKKIITPKTENVFCIHNDTYHLCVHVMEDIDIETFINENIDIDILKIYCPITTKNIKIFDICPYLTNTTFLCRHKSKIYYNLSHCVLKSQYFREWMCERNKLFVKKYGVTIMERPKHLYAQLRTQVRFKS